VKSLRSHEGYMLIDNRNTPGVSDAEMVAMGYPVGAGRGLYESATYTCSHCNAVVVIEPKRTRDRGYCRKCSQRICDGCNALYAKAFECIPMSMIVEQVQEAAEKKADPMNIILPWELSRSSST
jgi:phage terminase large subunit GpA-like protein